ncbi:tetratricopeptide repeat protein [Desulfosporosinus sp. SYSU MS00001]|uniref:tetratricopeptide repeat protein n=1 Tax=Desulfosporosinus sp. SYSU MS00001 TaxID=3416284 RepID=UPI003CF6E80D
MQGVQIDKEILYVQKIYFFMFLATLTLFVFTAAIGIFGVNIGLIVLSSGLIISYIAMVKKRYFSPPERKVTAQRMAHSIAQDTSPLSLSRFASQLYYYFHEPTQAISLLEKFLSSQDPLLCTTLCDILLKEGRPIPVLYIIRDNPNALFDPLLLATQGVALLKIGKIPEAIKLFERSLHAVRTKGFPNNGSPWLTRKLLSISYIAGVHHNLGDCYFMLKNLKKAKYHYKAGNLLLFDISLWRYYPSQSVYSTQNCNISC